MFNFKLNGIAAGAAFLFSFIIGLVRGNGFFPIFFRALCFGALFFGISCLVFWLAAQFLPELLAGGDDDLGLVPGSRIDITEEPLAGAFPMDASEEVDDIAGRPSASRASQASSPPPLDQNENAGYNKGGDGLPEDLNVSAEDGAPPHSGGEALPNMDDFSGAAAETSRGGMDTEGAFDTPEPRRPASSSRKPPAMAGDFNPRELAQAIQTVLKKDEKG